MIIIIVGIEQISVKLFSLLFSAYIFKPSKVAQYRVLVLCITVFPILNSLLEDFSGDLPDLMSSQFALSWRDFSVCGAPNVVLF